MLGKDIEIEKRGNKITERELPFFFIKELGYGIKEKPKLRPATVPTVGMDKINAIGWKSFFIDYASSSSFHGLNHLAAPHRHPLERAGTIIIIICCLIALCFLSLNFWNQYQNDATVVVINNDYHHYAIIKPAVVICTDHGVDETKFPRVFQKYGIEDNKETRDFFRIIARSEFAISSPLPDVNVSSDKWLSILYDLKIESVVEVIMSEDDIQATWVVTDRGFCVSTYNYAASYSSFEYWMNDNWTIIPQPKVLANCSHMTANCPATISVSGDDIFFQQTFPGDIVDFTHDLYRAQLKYSTDLVVTTDEVSSTDDLRGLSYKQRDCKFQKDGGLAMWPIYTFNMCKRECIFKKMLHHCGCHHHFGRPIKGIPTCNVKQLDCIATNKQQILRFGKREARKCGCLPDCNYSYYTAVYYKSFMLSPTGPQFVRFTIFLPFPIQKLIREQVFGFIDFLAAVGGAAGLVLGASILSFVEFFYFLTLRCFCFYKKQH